MSQTFKNIRIPYPNEGVIRSAQLNDTVCPENSVQLAVNMNFDRVGAIQTRPGVFAHFPQKGGGGGINSFGTLNILNGTSSLYIQSGTNISYCDLFGAGTWVTARTLTTPTYKARFSQFLNRIWMCNGSAGDAIQTSGGGAFSNTLVPAGFPKGDYIQAGYEGRVWVADSTTDVVYFTDIVQFTPPATYALSFTLATNFIKNFSPQDGEIITGLKRVPRALLLFKQNHIYRIYGAYSVDAYPAYNVGTYSNESIVETKDGIYFHHSSGFYKFTYDGQPTEISRRVIDFVKAINPSLYGSVKGVWDGFDAILWSVGPVTVEGMTYHNCVMRYTISTQIWTIYDYTLTNFITAMVRHYNGLSIGSLIGTASGKVGTLDFGVDDFGEPICFEMVDRWRSYTDMYAKAKSISGINVYSKNGAGTELLYQTEKSADNAWEYIDTVNERYDSLFPNASTDDFNIVRLRLSGNTSGAQMIFDGIELLSIQDKGLNEN